MHILVFVTTANVQLEHAGMNAEEAVALMTGAASQCSAWRLRSAKSGTEASGW